jgi:hypothetical protein
VRRAAIATRRARALESFKTAADCIGTIEPGCSLFALTRGQFSMIDAILACLDQAGPADVSVWTWTVAEYEIETLARLRQDGRVRSGLLVIDYGARLKNAGLIRQWKDSHGEDSVRYVVNHAKIATVSNERFRLLLRGSFNLNANARFEQFDLTEGGADFELIRSVESSLPVLADDASGAECYRASKCDRIAADIPRPLFRGVKTWAK